MVARLYAVIGSNRVGEDILRCPIRVDRDQAVARTFVGWSLVWQGRFLRFGAWPALGS
jgi:hypothetical protein